MTMEKKKRNNINASVGYILWYSKDFFLFIAFSIGLKIIAQNWNFTF